MDRRVNLVKSRADFKGFFFFNTAENNMQLLTRKGG
jgi:hypothetical protein